MLKGGVTGKGAIICTGNVIITGHSDLSASSQVAILAGKDLTFRGTTKSQSLFTGLLYSEGALDIANLTLVGSAIAHNDDPEKASASVQEVTLVNQEEAATFDLKVEVGQPEFAALPGQAAQALLKVGVEVIDPNINDYVTPQGGWNGKPVVLELKYKGNIYNSTAEVLALLEADSSISQGNLDRARDAFTIVNDNTLFSWNETLKALSPTGKKELPLFQLDPNTILSQNSDLSFDFRRFTPLALVVWKVRFAPLGVSFASTPVAAGTVKAVLAFVV